MKNFVRLAPWVLTLALLSPLLGQDMPAEKPAKKPAAGGAAPPKSDDPNATPPETTPPGTAPPDAAAPAGEPPVTKVEESPLVKQPQTPDELLDATLLMLEIAKPGLAKMYLDKLMENPPDPAALNEMRDKYGSAVFLGLSLRKELRPASTKLLELANAAALERLQDPARIAGMVERLSGSQDVAAEAILELRGIGAPAIPPLLRLLQDPGKSSIHSRVLEVFISVGPPGIPVLIAALDSKNSNVRSGAALSLGYMRAKEAVPFLWQPALSDPDAGCKVSARTALARILNVSRDSIEKIAAEQVVQKLLDESRLYVRQQRPLPANVDGKVTLWTWDDTEGVVIPRLLDPAVASQAVGTRFAKLALKLAPQRRDVQVQYLSLALTNDSHGDVLPTGPGTAHDLALEAGSDVVGDVLSDALASGQVPAALAALDVLTQIGTRGQLATNLSKKSPIAAALNFPDRRVQFRAAVTVLQLDPTSTFAQSSRVVSILTRALENSGKPNAVVVQSSPHKASELGGLVEELGYNAIVAHTGREGFTAAAERVDVELVVLHAAMIRWPLSEAVANLRADARTSSIPIIIVGSGDLRPKLERYASTQRRVWFVAESVDISGINNQVKFFLPQVQAPQLTEEELKDQRGAAIAWLAHLASRRRQAVFNFAASERPVGELLTDPELAPQAMIVLGEIASEGAQRRFYNLSVEVAADVGLRVMAAEKLAFHIQRFGLLLKKSEVANLHQMWNTAPDGKLHTALGAVVGSLKPDSTLVGKRLQASPPGR